MKINDNGKGIPEVDRRIINYLSLYWDLCSRVGYEIVSTDWPGIKDTSVWWAFHRLLQVLDKMNINPTHFLEAQFKFWSEDAVHPVPTPRTFCDRDVGPTYPGLLRYEKFKAELAAPRIQQKLEDQDAYTELFEMGLEKLRDHYAASGDTHVYRGLVALVKDLHPAFIASYPEFVRSWLPRLDKRFDKVRKILEKMEADYVLKARIHNARRKVLGF